MLSKELLEEIKSGVDQRGANAHALIRLIDALIDESVELELIQKGDQNEIEAAD